MYGGRGPPRALLLAGSGELALDVLRLLDSIGRGQRASWSAGKEEQKPS
jgi:hypothetical protein